MNLPNALTIGRIAITPLIVVLPFSESWKSRLVAFVLFLVAGFSDYVDGYLARTRKQETALGRLLDPLADKALLVGTFIPMYMLAPRFPFVTPFGPLGLPAWVVVLVIGREVFMTVYRQAAKRRGVEIAVIGSAKWKTAFQLTWQGAAYGWFFSATAAPVLGWSGSVWRAWAMFNGMVGAVTMIGAIVLTVYSLALYLRSFGAVFGASPSR
jgi:CDP-diacylglycerol--glycerol-3-phosphate 3-phosphatidyltransferase